MTLEHDPVLLEPDITVEAHLVPAEHRWIAVSDGRVTVYGVCPVDGAQRCRRSSEVPTNRALSRVCPHG